MHREELCIHEKLCLYLTYNLSEDNIIKTLTEAALNQMKHKIVANVYLYTYVYIHIHLNNLWRLKET